jgi:RNA polymerase sigma factor (TIGR02999 family)
MLLPSPEDTIVTGDDQTTIHRLLGELDGGNRAALDELFPLVYGELSELAHRLRTRWRGDLTLNTTALVHEAYLKLAGRNRVRAESRAHFLALVAKAMRHILINYARDRRAQKRGGGSEMIPLDETLMSGQTGLSEKQADELVALDDALRALEQIDCRQSQVVECRFFGGMTVDETAAVVGVSARTVKREWAVAQAWLARRMGQTP